MAEALVLLVLGGPLALFLLLFLRAKTNDYDSNWSTKKPWSDVMPLCRIRSYLEEDGGEIKDRYWERLMKLSELCSTSPVSVQVLWNFENEVERAVRKSKAEKTSRADAEAKLIWQLSEALTPTAEAQAHPVATAILQKIDSHPRLAKRFGTIRKLLLTELGGGQDLSDEAVAKLRQLAKLLDEQLESVNETESKKLTVGLEALVELAETKPKW